MTDKKKVLIIDENGQSFARVGNTLFQNLNIDLVDVWHNSQDLTAYDVIVIEPYPECKFNDSFDVLIQAADSADTQVIVLSTVRENHLRNMFNVKADIEYRQKPLSSVEFYKELGGIPKLEVQ